MKWSFLLILLFGKCFSQNSEISIEANGQASGKREIYRVMLKDSTAEIIYLIETVFQKNLIQIKE